MKITNRQLLTIFNGISEVKKKKLPVKLGYAINKNLGIMQDSATAYNNERQGIVDKYCEKDENGEAKTSGTQYVFADTNDLNAYLEEMRDLLDIENELNIHTITIADIEKCDSDKFDALTPEELELLAFMIAD